MTAQRDQIDDLLAVLDSEDVDERVTAIEVLGEIGDAKALQRLRQRLRLVNKEMAALIAAVGKLKKRLKVK